MTRESDVTDAIRAAASREGVRLWRNNVGAGKLENGSFIRWGLANESPAMNRALKSADLVGIRPVLIGPEHLGRTLGVFVSREMKAPGWVFRGTEREIAQQAWLDLVTGLGGDARFSTGEWV